jgi:phytanoyl-CoA hydroxylase
MFNKLFDTADTGSTLSQCPEPIKPYVREILQTGITVIPASLPTDLCDQVRDGFVNFAEKNLEIFGLYKDEYGHYPRIINLHTAYKPLFDLFKSNEKALKVQDYLFGDETVVYTSLFYERGSAQSIHRDTPYFTTRPEYRYFGMWIALENTDEDNGPLSVVRRGHLIPEFDREAIARRLFPDLDAIDPESGALFSAYQDRLMQECSDLGLVTETLCVNKGDTIIWHPQAPHGGAEIRNLRRTRFSIVMHTTPLGVPVYHEDVFFNPAKPVSDRAPWGYIEAGGRQFADFHQVGFGHLQAYPATEFQS